MNKKTSTTDEKKKENFILKSIENSLIVRALTKFAKKIYRAALSSNFGHVLTSYDEAEKKCADSATGAFFSGGEKKLEREKKIRHACASQFEKSVSVAALKKIQDALMRFALTNYGVLLISFAFYSTVIFFVKTLIYPDAAKNYFDLAIYAISAAVSIFFFVSKKSLAQAIVSSRIVKAVCFDLLGIRSESVERIAGQEVQRIIGIPFIAGMALGILTFFIKPIYIVLLLGLVILTAVVFSSPEAGLLITFLALPFSKTTYLAGLMAIVTLSFFIKFICGRRTLRFRMLDIPVIVFILMTLSGGLFSLGSGSLPRALVYVCFSFGYFLVKMMFRSEKYVKRALFALTLTGTVVSVIGIIEYFIGSPSAIWQDATLFADIRGRVVSTFENPNVLAEFLIFAIPISLSLFASAKHARERFAALVSSALCIICLILTWSRGAWIGLLISGIFALLFIGHKWLVGATLALPLGVTGVMYLSTNVISRLTSITNFSDSSTSYRIGIWKSTLAMLKDTFFYGIGVGSGAFDAVFPYYAISGITRAEHAHSLYLQITAETGVFTLIVFLVLAFFVIQKSLSFIKTATVVKNKHYALGLISGIVAFLIMGLTDHVFYNYRIYLLFWLIAGLSSAHIMTAKESSEENSPLY